MYDIHITHEPPATTFPFLPDSPIEKLTGIGMFEDNWGGVGMKLEGVGRRVGVGRFA